MCVCVCTCVCVHVCVYVCVCARVLRYCVFGVCLAGSGIGSVAELVSVWKQLLLGWFCLLMDAESGEGCLHSGFAAAITV